MSSTRSTESPPPRPRQDSFVPPEPAPSGVVGPDPQADFLAAQGAWPAWARVILASAGLLLTLYLRPGRPEVLVAAATYLCLSMAAVILVRWGRAPQLRLALSLPLDVLLVTALVWAAGSTVYLLPIFYPILVIGYAFRGGVRLGAASALLCIAAYGLLLVLEYVGLLPRAPYALPAGQVYAAEVEPHVAFIVVALAVLTTLAFTASGLRRIRYYFDGQRRLLQSEREAHARTEQLQARLDETARLESLGRLAGGVAHDFNNLLTSILGYAGVVQEEVEPSSQTWSDLDEIIRAARRGADLTTQLLAYSRRQVASPEVFDLNRLVDGSGRMLGRVLGEDVDLRIELASTPALIKADPHQIERCLMNLAVNARDAMPGGGEIFIGTAVIGAETPAVILTVSDSGPGIPSEIESKIFEPFFTTKDIGKGTGLGLAMVYGVVMQCGGAIDVHSAPGEGATFVIRLPLASGEEVVAPVKSRPPPGGSETVLVAEDEPMVRKLTARALSEAGYQVLAAANGDEALRLAKEHNGPIELLLSDVVMPGLSGAAFIERFWQERPNSAVLLMSGYTADRIGSPAALGHELELLKKPFARETLLSRVRAVLDRLAGDGDQG